MRRIDDVAISDISTRKRFTHLYNNILSRDKCVINKRYLLIGDCHGSFGDEPRNGIFYYPDERQSIKVHRNFESALSWIQMKD